MHGAIVVDFFPLLFDQDLALCCLQPFYGLHSKIGMKVARMLLRLLCIAQLPNAVTALPEVLLES